VFCHVSLRHFVLVLFAFVVLDLVASVLSQEIGREERLRNDIFCVEWDVNHNSINLYNVADDAYLLGMRICTLKVGTHHSC